jgi:regulator of protease activity HflC (stomatin/prohibitin superfamily)
VTRVELQAIEPPRDIQQSMELQMRAERERRAAVTNAEAGKRAAILEAEGVRESAVLRAQGAAEARLAMANAEAEAITKIGASLPEGQAALYLLGLRYFEALPQLAAGKATTVFLPSDAAGLMGAIGALKDLIKSGSVLPAADGAGSPVQPVVRTPPALKP